MDGPPSAAAKVFARAQGEYVRTELELGDTFLDIARTTQDAAHARSCMRSALRALRMVDKFMPGSLFPAAEIAVVRDLRERLAMRLREALQEVGRPTRPSAVKAMLGRS